MHQPRYLPKAPGETPCRPSRGAGGKKPPTSRWWPHGLGAEAAYEVVLSSAGNTRLVYEVTEFDHEALTATLVATHSWFRSIDTISATGDDDGSDVTYDATLELRGPLALLDPLLGLVFDRIGDKAAAGLIRVLDGAAVA